MTLPAFSYYSTHRRRFRLSHDWAYTLRSGGQFHTATIFDHDNEETPIAHGTGGTLTACLRSLMRDYRDWKAEQGEAFRDRVRALREEAVQAGDDDQVSVCDEALGGCAEAARICARAISAAAAQREV